LIIQTNILAEVIEIVDDEQNAWPIRSFIAKLIVSTNAGKFPTSHLTFTENISNDNHKSVLLAALIFKWSTLQVQFRLGTKQKNCTLNISAHNCSLGMQSRQDSK
jgi:hypothetical protein